MKKKYRVLKSQDFSAIIRKKPFFMNQSFALYQRPNALPNTRIGISVSKKLGKAVQRNKIKRQVRSMCQSLYTFQERKDVILLVRQGYLDQDYANNLRLLTSLYQKSNVQDRKNYEIKK